MAKDEARMRKTLEELLERFGIELKSGTSSSGMRDLEKADRGGDYGEIIEKTQQEIDRLQQEAEGILKQTGMSREQVESYVANPANFSQEQWEALEKFRQEVAEFKRQAHAIAEAELPKAKTPQLKKSKKGPGKKKEWIRT